MNSRKRLGLARGLTLLFAIGSIAFVACREQQRMNADSPQSTLGSSGTASAIASGQQQTAVLGSSSKWSRPTSIAPTVATPHPEVPANDSRNPPTHVFMPLFKQKPEQQDSNQQQAVMMSSSKGSAWPPIDGNDGTPKSHYRMSGSKAPSTPPPIAPVISSNGSDGSLNDPRSPFKSDSIFPTPQIEQDRLNGRPLTKLTAPTSTAATAAISKNP